ncbi:hypothetical protein Ahy_B06g081210 [Arachis hypogaea]|uniref:Aminotransferase-like plant mobile domain-containing protein n=1 Tax=Arachis hypogaea TaxID=3818 RepID=A0A444YKJ1_ARAHY|nr:hypothetical protein Ahy_B06g081210 [Arachis hypogaea]
MKGREVISNGDIQIPSLGCRRGTVKRYARVYIMMLLSTQLFSDKSNTRMHIQWLPYVARLEDMGGYSWESAVLSWLYCCLFYVTNRNVVRLARPLQLVVSSHESSSNSRILDSMGLTLFNGR